MASLFDRNGTYYAEFYDAHRAPKGKRISLRTRRKREARKRIVELERDWERGVFDPWTDNPRTYKEKHVQERDLTLADALSAFIQEKQAQGRARSTITNYQTFCGGLIKRVGAQKPLSKLAVADVQAYVNDDSIARASRRTRYRHVKAWLRWCVRKDFVDEAATKDIAPPARAERMPKAVRPDDLEAIEEAIRDDYRKKRASGGAKEGELLWLIPLLWFGLYSGLRSSELGRLRWKHIDFGRSLIYIYQQKNARQQTIPLTAPARQVLEDLPRCEPEAFVFLAPGSDSYERSIGCFKRNLARKFKRYRLKAGIERPLTPHGLRHGFCTLLAEAGKSAIIIKEAARHADISTSMRYVHMANEHLKAELDDVFQTK
jgi:integrase